MMRFRHVTALLLFLVAALLNTAFGPPRLTDRDIAPTSSITISQLRTLSNARQIPELTSQATLLYDVDADQILIAQNERAILPMASLTKLMTALLVLEAAAQEPSLLDKQVTVRAEDLVGGATMGLLGGERRTVEDLLYGLLIPSGNDAATAIARYLGDIYNGSASQNSGSDNQTDGASGVVRLSDVDRFVAQMNQRAREMGLAQTNFVNPHGIDADGHVSSAADLLIITRTLLNHDLFRQIVQLAEVTIGGRPLKNTNQLLGSFPGADGIKTGTTPASGQSLVASITRNGHQVVMVILGSRSRYEDARTLYNYYEQNFTWSDGAGNGISALSRIQDEQGQRWYIVTQGDVPSRLLPTANAPNISIFRRIQPPPPGQIWYRGMRIGLIEWRMGGQVIGTQTLVLR